MMPGRKPKAVKRAARNAPSAPDALPRCPAHLSHVARKEWRRLAKPLFDMGVLSTVDRGALAAYCQSYARWVEAEEQLKKTPALLKTPSGYVQQSPWLSVANKQLELMGRYMVELGITPSSRSRVATTGRDQQTTPMVIIRRFVDPKDGNVMRDEHGEIVEHDPNALVLDGRL